MEILFLQNAGSDPTGTFIFMGLIFIVAYFFLIRPQSKRQKEQQKFVEGIAKGDKVVTTSGIYGRVMEVDEKTAVVQIDKGVNIRITRGAVSKEFTEAQDEVAKAK